MKENQTNLREKQQQALTELGSYLYQVRCQQGISIEDVGRYCCIRVSLLQAIEEGNLDALPEPVYIQGFIKQFADALGLNGSQLAANFPQAPILEASRSRWGKIPLFIQLRPIHLYLLYIVMVIGAVSSLSNLVQRSTLQVGSMEPQKPPIEQIPNPNRPIEVNLTQPVESLKPALMSPQQNFDKPVVVGVLLQEDSWLKVIVDGKTEFEGTLNEGEKRIWKANKELTVRAGNAGGVLVAFNNQEAQKLGEKGQVRQVTYPQISN